MQLSFPPAPASSAAQSSASALLLGLALRHLCERLELPVHELLAMLTHEVGSMDRSQAVAQAAQYQLGVIGQLLAAPSVADPG